MRLRKQGQPVRFWSPGDFNSQQTFLGSWSDESGQVGTFIYDLLVRGKGGQSSTVRLQNNVMQAQHFKR